MKKKRLKKKSPAKVKKALKKRCDILWSSITKQIHRSKHGDRCLWCGQNSSALQSDHIFNRWKHSTRWIPANCVVICLADHLFRKQREPLAWAEMVKENVPPEVMEDLKRLSEQPVTVNIPFLEETLSYLEGLDRDKPWETR